MGTPDPRPHEPHRAEDGGARVVGSRRSERSRAMVDRIDLDARLAGYIVDLVQATRDPASSGMPDLVPLVQYGASPRATIWLALASRAHAFLERRGYVTPTDIKAVAPEVMRHRVLPTFEAEAEGLGSDDLVQRILDTVPLP
ncbi:MAG: MoxR family ATPase [Planctomycetota bacterium]